MALEYKGNFDKSVITCYGVNIPKEKKCHLFSLKSELSLTPSSIPLLPGKSIQKHKQWLYGPAVCLVTRSVIYPCEKYRCSVPCPCNICQKIHPICRIPASQPCDCKDCVNHFENHTNFHATFHFGCKFCFQILKNIPNFNFVYLPNENRKSNGFLGLHAEVGPAPNLPFDYMTGKISASEVGFQCDACGVPYCSLANLKEHILTNHVVSKIFIHGYESVKKNVGPIDLKCYQCSSKYSTIMDLRRHIDSVHYEEHFECDKCGKQFSRQDNMLRHKSVHESDANNQFKCKICKTTFIRKDNYERHVKSIYEQSGSVQNKCIECDEEFCTSKLLRAHNNLKHINFTCDECNKSFTSKRNFQDHINKRICALCSECGKSFCNLNAMRSHKKIAHMCVECDICGELLFKTGVAYHKVWAHKDTDK